MKNRTNKTIVIEDEECRWLGNGIFEYKGRKITDTEEIKPGWFEMHYCDENRNLIPDTPTIICKPWRRE